MPARIATLETFVVNYPLVGQFKFFTTAPGQPAGRITAVVKMTTDDGQLGWGQCVPSPRWSYETIESVVTTIHRYLAPEVIGRDVRSLDDVLHQMDWIIAGSFSRGQPIAKSGIDEAWWDVLGKQARRPVHELLSSGSSSHPIELSWTLDPPSLDVLREQIDIAHSRGYRSFNLKLGRGMEADLANCREVRSWAPDDHLWVDANGGYDLDAALTVAPRLAELGVSAIEQPFPGNRLSWYRRLKQQAALPILIDETLVTAVEVEEFHALGMLDGVVLKVARSGGLTESLKIAQTAERLGLMIYGSGLTDPDISLAASLHLFAACGLKHPVALNGPQFLGASILRTPIEVANGRAMMPGGAGLGIEVDEDKLAAMSVEWGGC